MINQLKYKPRTINFNGIRKYKDYLIKIYSVQYDVSNSFPWSHFENGITESLKVLPLPARKGIIRPGIGFLIAHQGKGADYVCLFWWDRENELPCRVFIYERDSWRTSQKSESFCVWDMEIMWFERQAFVSTILDGGNNSDYLNRIIIQSNHEL